MENKNYWYSCVVVQLMLFKLRNKLLSASEPMLAVGLSWVRKQSKLLQPHFEWKDPLSFLKRGENTRSGTKTREVRQEFVWVDQWSRIAMKYQWRYRTKKQWVITDHTSIRSKRHVTARSKPLLSGSLCLFFYSNSFSLFWAAPNRTARLGIGSRRMSALSHA